MERRLLFREKARESLAGAESEFTQGRFNNCVNRSYYACFQAAVAALDEAGIVPGGAAAQWSHAFVPSQFDGQLIGRRKLYSSEQRGVLARLFLLRQAADYGLDTMSQTQAERAMRRARAFVSEVAGPQTG